MSLEYPDNLRYVDTHEYVGLAGDIATIGISAFAVDQLGDIVFVELPEVGSTVTKGDTFGTIESVKAVEDLKAPISGEVVEVNSPIMDTPEQITEDPYTVGWLMKVKITNSSELDSTISAAEYSSLISG
jgi:glycine cleavage system H protein